MGNYTKTPAVIKARQNQMNIPKRIFILKGREKGWSDNKIAYEWFCLTSELNNSRGFQKLRAKMEEEGTTIQDLEAIRKQQNDA